MLFKNSSKLWHRREEEEKYQVRCQSEFILDERMETVMKNIFTFLNVKVIRLMALVYSKIASSLLLFGISELSREAKGGKDDVELRCGEMENRRWKNKYWPIKQRRA